MNAFSIETLRALCADAAKPCRCTASGDGCQPSCAARSKLADLAPTMFAEIERLRKVVKRLGGRP